MKAEFRTESSDKTVLVRDRFRLCVSGNLGCSWAPFKEKIQTHKYKFRSKREYLFGNKRNSQQITGDVEIQVPFF